MGKGERPEHTAPADIFYNEDEAAKYTTNTRMIAIQEALTKVNRGWLCNCCADYERRRAPVLCLHDYLQTECFLCPPCSQTCTCACVGQETESMSSAPGPPPGYQVTQLCWHHRLQL